MKEIIMEEAIKFLENHKKFAEVAKQHEPKEIQIHSDCIIKLDEFMIKELTKIKDRDYVSVQEVRELLERNDGSYDGRIVKMFDEDLRSKKK